MAIQSFRDLIAWQKAMEFAVEVYRNTGAFPKEEIFGLKQQLRRASVSVPCNIAEGHGRGTRKDYLNFLSIAFGSLNEAQTQIMLAERLGYVSPERSSVLLALAGEVARLLNGLRNALRDPNP